eukprot:TRINITY_DN753_c0_g1_i2.p1 TRINITY_DN753_c0_g1~~TRINITY_DN753_c0_g1_i2.p1  ORF type:complete len:440 (-),score=141.16 TRINITY_DN753_c0_g1_i2:89-1408(-)
MSSKKSSNDMSGESFQELETIIELEHNMRTMAAQIESLKNAQLQRQIRKERKRFEKDREAVSPKREKFRKESNEKETPKMERMKEKERDRDEEMEREKELEREERESRKRREREDYSNSDRSRSPSPSRKFDDDLTEFSVHVGDVPRWAREDDLIDKFSAVGECEVNIPKHRDSNQPKGFAFIKFFNMEAMEKCLTMSPPTFTNPQTGDQRTVSIRPADRRNKLNISGFLRNSDPQNVEEDLSAIVGVPIDRFEWIKEGGGRGYAVITFKDHDNALVAMRALAKTNYQGNRLVINMADQKYGKDEKEHKTLFFKGLAHSITEPQLEAIIGEGIDRAVIPLDRTTKNPLGHAFVHFKTREAAEEARRKFHERELEGRRVFVDWSQPQSKYNSERKRRTGDYGPMRNTRGYGSRDSGRDRRGRYSPSYDDREEDNGRYRPY